MSSPKVFAGVFAWTGRKFEKWNLSAVISRLYSTPSGIRRGEKLVSI